MEIQNIPYSAINRILELIAGCDKIIAGHRSRGEKENGLSIRQEKYLKNQYLNDLNEILQKSNMNIQMIVKEDLEV
jgi:hypothetical protein